MHKCNILFQQPVSAQKHLTVFVPIFMYIPHPLCSRCVVVIKIYFDAIVKVTGNANEAEELNLKRPAPISP